MENFQKADKRKKPSPELLFTDVYQEVPIHLRQQYNHMREHIYKYPDEYPLQEFEKIRDI